jgi:hypothetical protein
VSDINRAREALAALVAALPTCDGAHRYDENDQAVVTDCDKPATFSFPGRVREGDGYKCDEHAMGRRWGKEVEVVFELPWANQVRTALKVLVR